MTIESVKLRDLTPNPNNPRKSYNKDSLAELAASIKAKGCQQAPAAKKLRGKKREIIFGNRRYFAHMLLVEAGDLSLDDEIDVDVRENLSEQDAKEIALIENVQREEMNPVDEAEAYADLVKQGEELPTIAARVGKSEMTIRRRLAIASLCKEAKAALRNAVINLSIAEALTIGTGPQQKQIVAEIKNGHRYNADRVRNMLLESRPSVGMAIFPIERYKGRIAADLFQDAETSYFDDADQFLRLQREAVEEKAEALRETASFVEICEDWYMPHALYDRSRAKKSGVVIHMNPNGHVEIHEGLRKVEQVAASVKKAIREENAKVRPEYAEPVKRYINAHKTVAVQAAILGSPRTARIVAIVGMMCMRECMGVSLTRHAGLNYFGNTDETASSSHQKIEEQGLVFARLLGAKDDDLEAVGSGIEWLFYDHEEPFIYEKCKALTDEELDSLHLFLTTLTMGVENLNSFDGDPASLFNMVANDLGVNMVENWRPDAFFLGKRNRGQVETIMKEAGMPALTSQAKKSEMVGIAAARFAAGETEEARTWLPGAMQFPATGPDVSADHRHREDGSDAGEDDDAGDDYEPDADEADDAEAYADAAE